MLLCCTHIMIFYLSLTLSGGQAIIFCFFITSVSDSGDTLLPNYHRSHSYQGLIIAGVVVIGENLSLVTMTQAIKYCFCC
jgi:hypothetical protein